MICPLANFEEVYKTAHGAVYQCSRQNCYWLEFAGSTTAFKVGDFLDFKKKIDAIDISAMIIDSSRTADFTIVMPFRTPRCFVLTINDVLNLRELLDGAKFMITLNSMVQACMKGTPSRVA
ncbi:hypothetical protein JHJ32_04060 [Parapedobacter sp. ISTM3]|uniref:Uncharacterized protein n=1 Tax=Parapedobacter luteus TaxID=623280 RepID=A0A1T5C8C7_9SPHI|nr:MULTISPECIES: hypothetical protein [Parapedobacter]MBK1439151.1 hypothetical protein [Parapedobacter sp. ISTM3]SKB55684.1 hypothetical protein SAMN05660226_01960 [Parapedobacter luteus]